MKCVAREMAQAWPQQTFLGTYTFDKSLTTYDATCSLLRMRQRVQKVRKYFRFKAKDEATGNLFVLHKKCTWERSGEMRPHFRISRAVQIERQIFVVDEEN